MKFKEVNPWITKSQKETNDRSLNPKFWSFHIFILLGNSQAGREEERLRVYLGH